MFLNLLLFGPLGLLISYLIRCISKEGTVVHYVSVYVYFAINIIFGSFIYLFIKIIILPFTRNNLFRYLNKLVDSFFKQYGTTFKSIDPHFARLKGGAVVVVNHQSFFDIFVILGICQHACKMVPVAKRSLFYLGPFGLATWLAGSVAINRSNQKEAHKTMDRVAKVIRGEGTKVLVFAEGTRNTTVNKTRELLPFKTGAFKMAIECQVPVIPLVISPYYYIIGKNNFFGKGEIAIRALPPIETKGMLQDDMKRLTSITQERMQEAYTEFVEDIEKRLPPDHPYMLLKNEYY